MTNELIRNTAKQYNVRLWEVADKLNMQDSQLSRKLRHELTADETNKIMGYIKEIASNR